MFEQLFDTYLVTMVFTWFTMGIGAYSLFVLPKKQEREVRKKAAAEAAQRGRIVELRRAA
jgi:hypothetical protein